MANNQLTDTFKVSFTFGELDKDNNPTGGNGDTATIVSSDTASLTVVLDATPAQGSLASGFFVGGSKIQTGVVVTGTASHTDGTPVAPPTTITFDIVAGAAVSAGFSLGTAVPQ